MIAYRESHIIMVAGEHFGEKDSSRSADYKSLVIPIPQRASCGTEGKKFQVPFLSDDQLCLSVRPALAVPSDKKLTRRDIGAIGLWAIDGGDFDLNQAAGQRRFGVVRNRMIGEPMPQIAITIRIHEAQHLAHIAVQPGIDENFFSAPANRRAGALPLPAEGSRRSGTPRADKRRRRLRRQCSATASRTREFAASGWR